MKQRFDHDAKDVYGAIFYLKNRATQLLMDGYKTKAIHALHHEGETLGAMATFNKDGVDYNSYYLLKSRRGQGYYKKIADQYKAPVLTTPDCKMSDFLSANEIPYKVACNFTLDSCYTLIEQTYGDTQAKRSGCFYMDHIDEGVAILQKISVLSYYTKQAWCLHPILQVNSFLEKCKREIQVGRVSPYPVLLATEYRNIANAYLNSMDYRKPHEIQMSDMPEVNKMLVADKVQNRKQFEQHRHKFSNAVNLDRYFRTWLERLEVSEERYQELAKNITINFWAL